MKKRIIFLIVSIIIGLLSVEVLLRITEGKPEYEITAKEDLFWKADANLGWDKKPYSKGFYSNGYFRGYIINDKHGNRLNSDDGTYIKGYRDIFFIGDSIAVSLEVNNSQTIPAIIEKNLRARGLKINVVNLGVRGYGTDQSVLKAILHAKFYNPVEIIYLYSGGDFSDNNILIRTYRKYGKGVYIKDNDNDFIAYNYPVPNYSNDFAAGVVLDNKSAPSIIEKALISQESQIAQTVNAMGEDLKEISLLYKNLSKIIFPDEFERKRNKYKHIKVDPFELINKEEDDFLFALYYGLLDGGLVRLKHKDYYDDQFKFIVNKLYEIPGLKRIHLVQFPGDATLELMQNGKPSTDKQLFDSMLKEKIIDSYINLNQLLNEDHLNVIELQCPKDDHFCATGNTWVAEKILGFMNWNSGDYGVENEH